MTIHVKCSKCFKLYNLSETLNWKRAKCTKCSEEFIIKETEEKSATTVKQEEKAEKQKVEWINDIENNKNSIVEVDLSIKPKKISFILFSNPLIVIWFLLAIVFIFIFIYVSIWILILVYLIFAWENIKYKKENYILTDRKIIYNNWSLISDNSTEIKLDKITEVKASLPFFQYLFFKTWNLYIKTAWSWSSKIRFSNITNTTNVYDSFLKRMQKNGFHLKKDKLVQSEKPHIVGVLWEVFSQLIWSLFVVLYLLLGLNDKWTDSLDTSLIIPLLIVIIVFVFINLVFKYLDLKKRRYEIFTDTICYYEWFLSKHYAFIPMEVISDIENTQSFFSKIFGLHDIIISSAWASNKIIFKNMVNWEKMIENIRYLKDSIIMSEKDVIEWEKKVTDSIVWFKDKIEQPLDFNKDFEGNYKMDITKTIVETLPFLITGPGFIIILIARLIKLFFTDYSIKKTTIESKFELLSTKLYSFTIEKITWVQFKQSFIDKWFWTCSIKFWSIGSGTPITFDNIKKTKWLEEQILSKIWIRKEEKVWDIEIDFSFSNFIKANILLSLLIIIFFPITIVIFIYKNIFFDKKRYLREIYKNYIKTQNWIFFVTKKYILFRHIKWVKSTKYPLTNTWKIYLNVAWEVVIESKSWWLSKWSSSWIFSNSVDISYIKNVFESHDKIDVILNGWPINMKKIAWAKQDIINTVLPVSILFILFFYLLIFIPLTIWIIKVKYWVIENDRILFGSGIIYKKRQTILYDKFNFIDSKRGFLNKIFKNGSVDIYTIWSSSIDMKISNIDNYWAIYKLLKKD